MSEVEALRREIRALDGKILELVHERNRVAQRIGLAKRKAGEPLQNYEAEKSVLDHALESGKKLGVHEETVRGLVRLLIEAALRVQERDESRRPPPGQRSALVVGGGGRMGQWFCRFLGEEGYQVYVDDPQATQAYPKGTIADRAYDLVLLATPPSAVPGLVDAVGASLPDGTVLLDIASVKGGAAARLRALARAGKRVASLHPMFGPQTEVLMGRNVLVLDAGDRAAREKAKELFAHTTAQTRELPLEEHDALMAEVLGLAHATSLAFNAALAAGARPFAALERVASTTFAKQVAVSREVAQENPDLYYEVQTLNPATDAVLARLEQSVKDLRAAVRTQDRARFVQFMERGRRYYAGGG